MGRNTSSSKFINTYTHTYIQWNTTQLEERMKFCHLQPSGWTWRTLSEISLIEKDEYCMIITYTQNLRNTTSDYNKKEADTRI